MFEKLDRPVQWQEYFTKYPHGLTIFEAICKWTEQVDLMVEHLNLTQTQIDKLFTDTLPENIQSVLDAWYNDGTLNLMINGTLFTALEAKLAKTNTDMTAIEIKLTADILKMKTITPKFTYTTLALLQAGKPTDDGNLYVIDGYITAWNGTAWYKTTVLFQSVGMGDNTIDINKTKFIRKSLNRNNPATEVQPFSFDAQGEVTTYANTTLTGYIPVTPGETIYQVGNSWTGYFYDTNKVKLSAKNFGVTTIVVPANAYFYRTSHTTGTTLAISPVNSYEEYGKVFFTDTDFLKAVQINGSGSSVISKKWVAFGDSITEVNATATKRYYDYINDETPLTVVNMGVGGSGFKRGEETSLAYYQRILTCPTDLNFMTIYGSGNDLSLFANLGNYNDTGTATICGCVNKTLDNFFSRCPAVPVGIIAPVPWSTMPTTALNNQMEQYVEKLRQIANYRGVPFLDLYHGSNLRPEVGSSAVLTFDGASADGSTGAIHLNNTGHKIIYPKIREFIKTLI